MTTLIVYVDDIILPDNHEAEMTRIKGVLSRKFEMKDLENLKYFMSMEVTRSSHGILNLIKKIWCLIYW